MAQFRPMSAAFAMAQLERLGVIKIFDEITSQTIDINKTTTLKINGTYVKKISYDIFTAEYTCDNIDGTTQTIRNRDDINVEYKQ